VKLAKTGFLFLQADVTKARSNNTDNNLLIMLLPDFSTNYENQCNLTENLFLVKIYISI